MEIGKRDLGEPAQRAGFVHLEAHAATRARELRGLTVYLEVDVSYYPALSHLRCIRYCPGSEVVTRMVPSIFQTALGESGPVSRGISTVILSNS